MSERTRRRFLEESMLAAAAAVSAGPVSRVLADEATPKAGPNDRLSVAVIGVNGRGGDHLKHFTRRDDAEVTHICDADSNVGGKVCEAVGKQTDRTPKYVQDMREIFDDKSIDLVTIATPNHWHALCSIWAMQAGKDVYVEKPVSHNVSEGRRIVETARKHNRICQTGTQCRSQQGTKDAIEYIHSGKIGDVKVARGLCYKTRRSIGSAGNYEVPQAVNFDLWCGPAPTSPVTRRSFHYDWHWIWDYGNGDLGNQGIHQMDVARWGLGVDDIGYAVTSYGGRFGYEDAGETANTQVSIHDYGDKRLVFEVRGLSTQPLRGASVGVIFEGTDGYVVMTSYSSGAAFDLEGNKVAEFSGGGDHYGNFVDAVRDRKPEVLNADILEGHLSSALCHLGNISYRLGESVSAAEAKQRLAEDDEALATLSRFTDHLEENGVKLTETPVQFGPKLEIDPAAETFVGRSDAEPMLTREYRAPFVVPGPDQV